MATYVNDLRLKEIATGDEAGTWGTSTNTNLELIAEAFSYGTEAITTNADTHTTTIADGATDPGRSLYLKYTGTLDSACTITLGPNTVSKMWFIENATTGSQNIIISQGSGANVTIPAGETKVVYSDGAGAGAAITDAFASLKVSDAAQTNITSVGALDGGSITSGFGSIDVGSSAITTTGTVTGNTLAGTLSTAAQPNITSVGTLTGLVIQGTGSQALTVNSSTGNSVASFTSTDSQAYISYVDDSTTGVNYVATGAEGNDLVMLAGAGVRAKLFNNGDFQLYEDTATTPKFFWDASAESLGIGTTSIDFQATNRTVVHVEGSAGALLALEDTGAKSYFFQSGNDLLIENDTSTGSMIFGTNASTERMRIDSSGNLLVGTTSSTLYSSSSETGTNITAQGGLYVAHNGTNLPVFNRITSDGDIVDFRKNGSTVGSIGTVGGDLAIYSTGSSHAGLRFLVNGILPTNNAGTINDNTVDLGGASNRFKDLVLSGSVKVPAASNGIEYSSTAFITPENNVSGAEVSTPGAFVVKTGSTPAERMRIDSSGNVAIGTSSANSRNLYIQGAGAYIGLNSTTGGFTTIEGLDNGTKRWRIGQNGFGGADGFAIYTGASDTERMRIDSSGNVRVGVGNTFEPTIQFTNSGRVASNPGYSFNGDLDTGMFNPSSQGTIAFSNNGTESVRIDSSGNLLVGCTSAGASNGVTLHSSGYIQPRTNTGIPAIYADREGSDGSIIELRKDGSAVGSIGVAASDNIYFAGDSGSTKGIYINEAALYPADTGGAVIDNAVALGQSSVRWTDLYLSGGAYLGGTAAANHLDDYEEGTFTLSPNTGTLSSQACKYTKVGGIVTFVLEFTVGTGGATTYSGLPFATNGTCATVPYVVGQTFAASRTYPTMVVGAAGTTINMRDCGSGQALSSMAVTAGATYHVCFSYTTD
jgi:hypothetical protein